MDPAITSAGKLIPELALWNEGKGIALTDWIWIEGRADHALGFCAMFWPDVIEVAGYFLRTPVDQERLRGWERSGATRPQIETAMNVFFLEDVFPHDQTDPSLKSLQIDRMAETMRDMLAAKLRSDFPNQSFSVFVMDDDDFGISFHRV